MASEVYLGVVDVYYLPNGKARAAALIAEDSKFERIIATQLVTINDVAPYESGALYKREMPAILALVRNLAPLNILIIDGYVDLDPAGRPGLGIRLHRELQVAVIGIAKSEFLSATHAKLVYRGRATKPLFITSVGIAADEAAEIVQNMKGRYRLPDAVRCVDQLSRRGTPDNLGAE